MKVLRIVTDVMCGLALYELGRLVERAAHKETHQGCDKCGRKSAMDGMYCHAGDAVEDINDAIEHLECAADSINEIFGIWSNIPRDCKDDKGGDKDGETGRSSE